MSMKISIFLFLKKDFPLFVSVEEGELLSRKKKSFVWKYCTKDGKERATCVMCGKSLWAVGGSTSCLKKHLNKFHGILD